jgi:hypothetical protein
MIFWILMLGVIYIPFDQYLTHENSTGDHEGESVSSGSQSLLQKMTETIQKLLPKNDEAIEDLKEEIAVREGVLHEMDKAIPKMISDAYNVRPLCPTGSVVVGEIQDPREKIQEEISQLKMRLADLED